MNFYSEYIQLKNKSRFQIYNNLFSKLKNKRKKCGEKFDKNNNLFQKLKDKQKKINLKTLEISKKNKLNSLESSESEEDNEINFLNSIKYERIDRESSNKTIFKIKKQHDANFKENDLWIDLFVNNSDENKNIMVSELDIELSDNKQVLNTTRENYMNYSNINKTKNKEVDFKKKIESSIKKYIKQNMEEKKLQMIKNLIITNKNFIKAKKKKIFTKNYKKCKKSKIQEANNRYVISKVKKLTNFNYNNLIRESNSSLKYKKLPNIVDLKKKKNKNRIKIIKTHINNRTNQISNLKRVILTDFNRKQFGLSNKSFFLPNDNNLDFNNSMNKILTNKMKEIYKSNNNYNRNKMFINNFKLKKNKSPFYENLLRRSLEPRKSYEYKIISSDYKNKNRKSNGYILSPKNVKPFNIMVNSFHKKSLKNPIFNIKTMHHVTYSKENSLSKCRNFKSEKKKNLINYNRFFKYHQKDISANKNYITININ